MHNKSFHILQQISLRSKMYSMKPALGNEVVQWELAQRECLGTRLD